MIVPCAPLKRLDGKLKTEVAEVEGVPFCCMGVGLLNTCAGTVYPCEKKVAPATGMLPIDRLIRAALAMRVCWFPPFA